MINVQDLTKRFGNVTAIGGISFSAAKGEVLGLLGPNGAGKTTTMRMLTAYIPPSGGSARVAGFDVSEHPMQVKRRTGYLPESAPLYRDMRVGEYLHFAASVKGMKGTARQEDIVLALRETGIEDVKDRLIGKLSKGYRQRVGLAQALLGNPEVLVLDEPTAGLDPKQIVEIRQLIKSMAGKRTVILSTHILPEVALVCDRVVIMHRGRVVAVDTPANLSATHQKQRRVHITLRAPLELAREALAALPGVRSVSPDAQGHEGELSLSIETKPDADLRERIAAAVAANGWGLLELRQQTLSLEDIFVDIVTEEPHNA